MLRSLLIEFFLKAFDLVSVVHEFTLHFDCQLLLTNADFLDHLMKLVNRVLIFAVKAVNDSAFDLSANDLDVLLGHTRVKLSLEVFEAERDCFFSLNG